MKTIGFAVMCVILLSAPAVSLGYTFDDVTVEDWAGSGASEAMCVVDFGSGNNYAFGYKWDSGAQSGETMLLALDSGTSLVVNYHYDPKWGFAVDGFEYDGYEIVSDGWITTYAGYWVSVDGENWAVSGFGTANRVLNSGDWDGWSQEYTSAGFWPENTPTTPVPEPATMTLLMLGLPLVLRRKK